jgi:hypothetical protein
MATQELKLKVLKAQCQAQEERYPGYRAELISRLGKLLRAVRSPAASGVRAEVIEELEDFGDTLNRKTAADGATAPQPETP